MEFLTGIITSIKDFVVTNYGKLTVNGVTGALAGIQIGDLIQQFIPATSIFGFWGGLGLVVGVNLWAMAADKNPA